MINRFDLWVLRHPQFLIIVSIITPLLALSYFAFDRAPPFEQVHLDPIKPVRAGEEVIITADVRRHHDRQCSTSVNRQLLDSNGVIHENFVDPAKLTAASIKAQDVREANKLRRAFPIPSDIPSGKTTIITHLAYACAWNPLHKVWPITITLEWPFEVLPPEPKTVIVITPPAAGASK